MSFFPVSIGNSTATYDWQHRKLTESQGFMGADVYTIRTAQISSDSNIAGFTANPGKMAWVKSITVSCWNKGFDFYVNVGQALYAGQNQTFRATVPKGGGSTTIPIKIWLFEGQQLNVYAVAPFPETIGADPDQYKIGVTTSTDMYTQDIFIDANETFLAIGDSITAGNLVTPLPNTHRGLDIYSFQIAEFLRSKGRDIRLVNWGLPGASSWQVKDWMLYGRYNVRNPSIITWNLGVNDIATAWDSNIQATFESAVKATVDWKRSHYPNSKLIFFGNTPLGDAKHDRADNLRNFLSTYVAGLIANGEKNIYYCNLGNAFNRLNTSFFSDNVTHPNAQGNIFITNVIKQFLIDQKIV